MVSSKTPAAAFLCLMVGAVASLPSSDTVFLDKQEANTLISRQRRNVGGSSTLEQACMEKVCSYEEARKHFQDSYRTDIFWAVYVDGDQCVGQPCKNGAMCSDSVGGYDCVCKSGFTGVHCEKDQTLCPMEKDQGCSQFCKPDYISYKCSCARGWKLNPRDPRKCEAAVTFPCGKVTQSRWDTRLEANARSNFQGLTCTSSECPWHALLQNSLEKPFCSGVILKENLVLTSAQCAKKYESFKVYVGKQDILYQTGEQTLDVSRVHVHPRFVEDRPDNDLAVIELRDRIVFKRDVFAACLPERDFAESVLMSGKLPAVVTGWKENQRDSSLQGFLMFNQLAYNKLPTCLDVHPGLGFTNRMGCTEARAGADCSLGSGSPLLSLYGDAFFLTGVVSQPPDADCSNGFIFQKVSRQLGWLQTFMGAR